MKWLLLFPDYWLAFSPSCLNFIQMLEENGQEYRIIYFDGGKYDNSQLRLNGSTLCFPYGITKVLSALKLASLYKIALLFCSARKMKDSFKFNRVVGFDALGYLSGRLLDSRSIYYSLEVSKSIYDRLIEKHLLVDLLIIQTKERADYLNKNCGNVVYLQNSPIVNNFTRIEREYTGKLVYFGGISKSQGVEICIEFLYQTKNTTLLLKGISTSNKDYIDSLISKHETLIESKRLVFDFSYVETNQIKKFLENFDIGLCFIDPLKILTDGFNFESSPSGKIFNYFLSGLPVIANKLIGFKPIQDLEAGILLENDHTENMLRAIETISTNYPFYRNNAYNAAEHFNYRKMFNDSREKILSQYNNLY